MAPSKIAVNTKFCELGKRKSYFTVVDWKALPQFTQGFHLKTLVFGQWV